MRFYSQLLDPVRAEEADGRSARSILMLQAIQADPVVLSMTNAIASKSILSPECAEDKNFLWLVEQGRIQFWKWPGGESANQSLISALGDDDYIFSGWPECINLKNTPEFKQLRKLAADRVRDGKSTTRVDELDKMLDRARDLGRAIDRSKVTEREAPRTGKFVERILGLPKKLTNSETVQEPWLANLIEHVNILAKKPAPEINSRSKVYRLIDKFEMDNGDKGVLRELVDAEYNALVAESLGVEGLHTVISKPESTPLFNALTNGERTGIEIYEDPLLPKTPDLLTWQSLVDALKADLSRYGGVQDRLRTKLPALNYEAMRDLLAKDFSNRRIGNARYLLWGGVVILGALTQQISLANQVFTYGEMAIQGASKLLQSKAHLELGGTLGQSLTSSGRKL